jgi:hypothetical protein
VKDWRSGGEVDIVRSRSRGPSAPLVGRRSLGPTACCTVTSPSLALTPLPFLSSHRRGECSGPARGPRRRPPGRSDRGDRPAGTDRTRSVRGSHTLSLTSVRGHSPLAARPGQHTALRRLRRRGLYRSQMPIQTQETMGGAGPNDRFRPPVPLARARWYSRREFARLERPISGPMFGYRPPSRSGLAKAANRGNLR